MLSSATAKAAIVTVLGALLALPAHAAAPAGRDACALLPQAKVAPILGDAVRQDQRPKAQNGFVLSTCIFAAGRKGAAAQFMLMTYPTPQGAALPASQSSTDSVAGVKAAWNGNFLFASRGRERFVIMPLSNSESEKHGMAKALLAVALAAR